MILLSLGVFFVLSFIFLPYVTYLYYSIFLFLSFF
jgi:hypothetical protein